jgi:N-methylhydantoinase A/acetophenone carboxylase
MEPVSRNITGEYEVFNQTVEMLVQNAKRDLAGEGLDSTSATFILELDMLYGGQFHVKRALSPRLTIHGEGDVRAICDAFEKEFSEAFSPFVVNPDGGVFVDSFILKAVVPTKKAFLPRIALEGSDPAAAQKATRSVYWPEKKDFSTTNIYSFEKLRPGNVVEGPAIVEAEYTTLVVPPSLKFSINEHGLGILE